MTIEEANKRIDELSAELRSLDALNNKEKKAVDAKYSDARREIQRKFGDAKQALQDAKVAAVRPHKYEGEKVFLERSHHSWEQPKNPIFGIVQTYTPDVPLPNNTSSFNRPRIGNVFIRLIKKNGEPGLKFKRLNTWDRLGAWNGWKLVRDPSVTVQP